MREVLEPWKNPPENSTEATAGRIVKGQSNLWACGFKGARYNYGLRRIYHKHVCVVLKYDAQTQMTVTEN